MHIHTALVEVSTRDPLHRLLCNWTSWCWFCEWFSKVQQIVCFSQSQVYLQHASDFFCLGCLVGATRRVCRASWLRAPPPPSQLILEVKLLFRSDITIPSDTCLSHFCCALVELGAIHIDKASVHSHLLLEHALWSDLGKENKIQCKWWTIFDSKNIFPRVQTTMFCLK